MAFFQAMSWHEGEDKMHALTRVPFQDNPTQAMLPQRYNQRLSVSPLVALGVTDEETGEVWCSLWGGDPPVAQAVARGGIIGIRASLDAKFDPVARIVYGGRDDGEVIQTQDPAKGRLVSALSLHLEDRDRVKLFGRMMAGALNVTNSSDVQVGEKDGKMGNAQLVLQITQSLGNCPKYLNKKVITSHSQARPYLASDSALLSPEVIEHVHSADLFFISSRGPDDMDTNHRGGSPGFIRVQSPSSSGEGSVLVWPEYSGNNLYQTLGNLMHNSHAGLCIPNFANGNVLYVTGTAEVLVDNAAGDLIAKSKLAVKFTVTSARFVHDGLGFRGKPTEDISHGLSPYNPRVRYLRSEQPEEFPGEVPDDNRMRSGPDVMAKLVKKTQVTPSINRYRFSLSDPSAYGPWKPGQYIALDFSEELYMGYSHMKDDDPQSLNDDFLRTFTVASVPGKLGLHGEELEVVIRNVGNVTGWLSWQREGTTQVGVRGFGGSFQFASADGKPSAFIAAGIGITPLLGQLEEISDLKVLWTISIKDIGLVTEVLKECPLEIQKNMTVFVTGDLAEASLQEQLTALLENKDITVERRRMARDDLTARESSVGNWYLCTAPALRQQVQQWLPEQSIIFESFDY